jgi:hypothetical protein
MRSEVEEILQLKRRLKGVLIEKEKTINVQDLTVVLYLKYES